MKYCSRCGSAYNEGEKFCSLCGNNLVDDVVVNYENASPQNYVPNDNYRSQQNYVPNDNYVVTENYAPTGNVTAPKKSNKILIIALVGVGAFIILVIAILVLIISSIKPNNTQSDYTPSSTNTTSNYVDEEEDEIEEIEELEQYVEVSSDLDFEISSDGVLVKYTGNDTEVIIPDNVVEIGEYAFVDCKLIVSITIPDSVIKVGENAFYGCDNLTVVTYPSSLDMTNSGYIPDNSDTLEALATELELLILFNSFAGENDAVVYQYDFTGDGVEDWIVTQGTGNESAEISILVYSEVNGITNLQIYEGELSSISGLSGGISLSEMQKKVLGIGSENFETLYSLISDEAYEYDESLDLDQDGVKDYILCTSDIPQDVNYSNIGYYDSSDNKISYEDQDFFSWTPQSLVILSNNGNAFAYVASTVDVMDLKNNYFATLDNTNYDISDMPNGTYNMVVYDNTNINETNKVTAMYYEYLTLTMDEVSSLKSGDIMRLSRWSTSYDFVVEKSVTFDQFGSSYYGYMSDDDFEFFSSTDNKTWYVRGSSDCYYQHNICEVTFLCDANTVCSYQSYTTSSVSEMLDHLSCEEFYVTVTIMNGVATEILFPWNPEY